MKIDNQIRYWAQLVNESEDAIIYKNESIGRSDVPGEKHLEDYSDFGLENSDRLFDIGIQLLLTTIGEISDNIKRIPYKFEDDKVRILYEHGGVTKVYKSLDSWIAQNYSKLYRQFHDRFSYHSKKVEDYAAYPQYVTLQKGTYTINGFDGFDITITVKSNDGFMLSLKNFDDFSDTLISDIKQARKHGLQYHKPNLPKESEELNTVKENMVWDKDDAANFNLDEENEISTIRLLKTAIEKFTGWECVRDAETAGEFEISYLKEYPDTCFIQCSEGPESEFWKKLEEFIKENTTGNYGETKPQELDDSGSGVWAVPITLV